MKVYLDGRNIPTIQAFFDGCNQVFHIEEDRVGNFDALYDVLTALPNTELLIQNSEAMMASLGEASGVLMRVLCDAEEENQDLSVRLL